MNRVRRGKRADPYVYWGITSFTGDLRRSSAGMAEREGFEPSIELLTSAVSVRRELEPITVAEATSPGHITERLFRCVLKRFPSRTENQSIRPDPNMPLVKDAGWSA
jgi:hypothetical protein